MKRLTHTRRVLRSANSEEPTTACLQWCWCELTQNDRKIKLDRTNQIVRLRAVHVVSKLSTADCTAVNTLKDKPFWGG